MQLYFVRFSCFHSGALNLFLFLAVGSWITWLISKMFATRWSNQLFSLQNGTLTRKWVSYAILLPSSPRCALHLYWLLAVGSWITWLISSWDKNNFYWKMTNSQLFWQKMMIFFKPDRFEWKILICSACIETSMTYLKFSKLVWSRPNLSETVQIGLNLVKLVQQFSTFQVRILQKVGKAS